MTSSVIDFNVLDVKAKAHKTRNWQIGEFYIGRQCPTSRPQLKNRLEFTFMRFTFALCVIAITQRANSVFTHFSE